MKIPYFMLSICLLNSGLLIYGSAIKEPVMVLLEATKNLIEAGLPIYIERQKDKLHNVLEESAMNVASVIEIMKVIGCPHNIEHDDTGRISNVSNYRACIRLHNSLVTEGQRMADATLALKSLRKIGK